MTDAAWEHICTRHRDLKDYMYEIRDAIEFADEVRRDASFEHRDIHYRHRGAGSRSLRVVVHYRPRNPSGWIGSVVTAHFFPPSRARKEAQLWPQSEQK